MKTCISTLLFFFCFLVLIHAKTDICNITLSQNTRAASFANGEQVTINLDYSTDEAGGVRIFTRPYSNGALSPNYSANPSGLFSGTGTATGFFTITTGDVTVDEIRVEVYASDNTTLLRRFWIPVTYHFGQVGVHDFSFSHDVTVSSLLLGEQFGINFSHNITYPGGVRIFIRPFSNGALTPGYGASGSGLYSGTGSSSANFTITAGKNVHVDALRVQILNSDQSLTLKEFFIPVNLYFSTVSITNINPQSGDFPYNNDNRDISFNYSTTEAAGVRIFPRPWTNGALTPNYAASGSAIYMGSGTTTGNFTITSTNQRVDHTRFQVWDPNQTELLLEMLYPVDYTFGNFLISDISTCPPSPSRLENGQQLNINFSYYNDQGANARIFVRPFSNGALTPDYAASGSPLYPGGAAGASANFTISSGNVVVDQLRFQITSEDQSQMFAEYFIPVHIVFGSPLVDAVEPLHNLQNMAVSPNPASEQATVTLTLSQATRTRVYVSDLAGNILQVIADQQFSADAPQVVEFNAARFPAGVYAVVAEGQGFRETRKLVVVK